MNYYDKNIYCLIYANNFMKLKMRKLHAFYCVQFNVMLHKTVVCVSHQYI